MHVRVILVYLNFLTRLENQCLNCECDNSDTKTNENFDISHADDRMVEPEVASGRN